jgi:hypothetical protein
MLSIFILALSAAALVKFALHQWRMIWLTTANQPLSDSLRSVAGIETDSIGAQDFGTLMKLCGEVSPSLKRSTPWLREVKSYYTVVAALQKVLRPILRNSAWASDEMRLCSRFVAVVIDQHLSVDFERRAAVRSS